MNNPESNNSESNNFKNNNPDGTLEPIAIVGIGCRFPGDANNPSAYWELLSKGVDAISEVPKERWNLQAFFNENRATPGKTYTRHGGFIKNIEQFDAEFFGISPREAACMDPQQRLLLETTWEALADAGIDPKTITRTAVGVFMGIFTHDYNNLQLDSANRHLIDTHTGVGTSMSIVANRISYAFDLIGPSFTLDTACSSSLVALHLACQSLRDGESTLAIVGGANACLKPEFTIATSKASMLSPDGRCKSFDASANGYVRSEGMGVVILKPLSAAQQDGDLIYSVINSSVVNQDGKSDGLTVPNSQSQKLAIRAALKKAQLKPNEISYAEAHGTGTFVGDPIEANSIGAILSEQRQRELLIGSVKSNIGHLEAASGIASLIKVSLALQHQQIPPNLHFHTPNPQIEFEKYQMRVPTSLEAWPANPDGMRYACLNSFGFGGTNATIILAEAPLLQYQQLEAQQLEAQQLEPQLAPYYVLPLSAASPAALREQVNNLCQFWDASDNSSADICYSAAVRSGHLEHRVALIAKTKTDFIGLSQQFLAGKESPFMVKGRDYYSGQKLAYIFAGMGTQWWAMGRQLLNENPIFQATIKTCDELLSEYAPWSLIEELNRSEADSRINRTDIAQPAIFAIEIALAKVWQTLGVQPDIICGHSVGEIAAAYIAGALSLSDAIKVIFHRSRLQHKTAGTGGMLAVGLSPEKASALIATFSGQTFTGKVSIAVVNSPSAITLAGDMAALQAIHEQLQAEKIFSRLLNVEVPYHCAAMDSIKDELLTALASIKPQPTSTPLFSTVTGKLIDGTALDAHYWWRNVREPVLFAEAISNMALGIGLPANARVEVFLEVSPHPVLVQSINECLEAVTSTAKNHSAVFGSIKRKQDEAATMAATLGALQVYGYPIPWAHISKGQFVRLPQYAWQHQPYWRESDISTQDRVGSMAVRSRLIAPSHPLLGVKLRLAHAASIWDQELQASDIGFLADHQVYDAIVFPGAAYIEMALAASAQANVAVQVLENIVFEKALVLRDAPINLQCVLADDTFVISTATTNTNNEAQWVQHVSGKIARFNPAAAAHHTPINLAALQQRFSSEGPEASSSEGPEASSSAASSAEGTGLIVNTKAEMYQAFSKMGFNYQGDFCAINEFRLQPSEALARIELLAPSAADYTLYPPLLDNCFQAILGIVANRKGAATDDQDMVFLPMEIASLSVYQPVNNDHLASNSFWCHAQLSENYSQGLEKSSQGLEKYSQGISGDAFLYDNNGNLIIAIEGLYCVAVKPEKWAQMLKQDDPKHAQNWFNEVQWVEEVLQPRAPIATVSVTPKKWLIFGDQAENGAYLAHQLAAQGDRSILVLAAQTNTEFQQVGRDQFHVREDHPGDFALLLKSIDGTGDIAGIIYLWALNLPAIDQTINHQTKTLQTLDPTAGCGALLQLIQSLNKANAKAPLWLITQGGQPVTLGPVHLLQSPLWGFAQVIALEQPQLSCRCIDLDPEAEPSKNIPLLLQKLNIATLNNVTLNTATEENRMAFRNGKSFVARLAPASFSENDKSNTLVKPNIAASGTYLITGGFGALGKRVAQQLVQMGAKHLVLMSRRGALGHEQFISELSLAGVTIYAAVADVSQQQDVAQVLTYIHANMPPLRGIIHAAGVLDDGIILQQSAERFAHIMRPKVQGTWNLHQLTLNLPLDFFVCFSSIASLLGSPGQSNYAAGNAFMDALAHRRHSLGLPALSINWGPWAEDGMAATQLERLETKGFEAIETTRGLAIFAQLLNTDNITQMSVSPINWDKYFAAFPENNTPFFAKFAPKVITDGVSDISFIAQFKTVLPAERKDFLLKHIDDIVTAVFGYSAGKAADRQKSLFDAGLDSLMALEIKNRLGRSLALPLPTTLLFEHPTIEDLGAFLNKQLTALIEDVVCATESAQQEHIQDDELQKMLSDLDALSAEELNAILAMELADSL